MDPIFEDSFPIRKLFTISHVLCLTGQPYTIKLFDRLRSIIIVLSFLIFVKKEQILLSLVKVFDLLFKIYNYLLLIVNCYLIIYYSL